MGLAFALSLAVSGFMVHAGVGDVPNDRSNHSATTPTSGGLGIIAGLGGAFFLIPQFYPVAWLPDHLPQLLSLMWAVAMLGLLDDIFPIPALVKFGVMVLIAGLAVWIIGPVTHFPYASGGLEIPYVAGFLGAMLWIFVIMNAVNFMDGSNGMMASVMLVTCLILTLIGAGFGAVHAILIPACLAAALAGFIPYNFRSNAHIFSGDVGSLLTGFGFAISCLWLNAEVPKAQTLFIGPVLIMPFLADVLLTMFWRAKHGENLFSPHRNHLYQKMISAGFSHTRTAMLYCLAAIVLGGFAMMVTSAGYHTFTIFVTLPVCLCIAAYYLVVRRFN